MGLLFLELKIMRNMRFAVFISLLVDFVGIAHAKLIAERLDIGERHPGQHVPAKIIFDNDSPRPVTVLRALPSITPVEIRGLPIVVPANGSAVIDIDWLISKGLGKQNYFVSFDLDDDQKKVIAGVSLFVDSMIGGEPKLVDFGVVADGKQAKQNVDVESTLLSNLRAVTAKDDSGQVAAAVVDRGKGITVTTAPNLAWGMHNGWVEVTTNSKLQPTAWVRYRFETRGAVVPESYAIGGGLERFGKPTSQTLFIHDEKKNKLELGKIAYEGSEVTIENLECPQPELSCRALKVTPSATLPTGEYVGTIKVELPRYKQTLILTYSGIVIATNTNIQDLTGNGKIGDSTNSDATSNISSALKGATSSAPAPIVMSDPPGNGPLLKWNVQNEQQLYGYEIFRADGENAPAQRMNDSIIHILSIENATPVEYRWRDTTAVPGHTYWYQIGTVDQRDARKDLTGRVKKTYTVDSATAK